MSAPCVLCVHPDRERFDAALRSGASVRAIAAGSGVSKSAVDRHKRNHLSDAGQGVPVEADPLPVEVSLDDTCLPPATASEPDKKGLSTVPTPPRWRCVAPIVRFLRSDRTPAQAMQGEVVTDIHPVFARALEAARVIVQVRKHPSTEGGSDA